MPHIVSLRARVSVDRYNRPTYEATATRYRALVTMNPVEIRTLSGEERVSRAKVTMAPVVVNDDDTLTFLDTLPAITPEHEITLPDGTKPVILSIEQHSGIDELQHLVIRT